MTKDSFNGRFRGLNHQGGGGGGGYVTWGGEGGARGLIVVSVCGEKLLETLSAYVYRDRWEGRQSVGERDREDRGDLSLRIELLAWTLLA
jgi:hypothetical protein